MNCWWRRTTTTLRHRVSPPNRRLDLQKHPFFSGGCRSAPLSASASHTVTFQHCRRHHHNIAFRHYESQVRRRSLGFISHRQFSSTAVDLGDETQDSQSSFTVCRRSGVRNVAVIAHVDHGKTTLVDKLLMASHGNDSSQASVDRLMDSGDLEKERGITITGKVTRISHKTDAGDVITINCADTPGHSDFSGEVDRFLSLSDGFLLVVDAAEGPKSQTKYVLSRALALGLKPIVVINKCDRSDGISKIDSGETENQLMALFEALGATDDQMNHLTLYASARSGWVTPDPLEALEIAESGYDGDPKYQMNHLLDSILDHVPEPTVRSYREVSETTVDDGSAFADDKFSLAAVTVGRDPFLGRTCTGRIISGSVGLNDSVSVIKQPKVGGGDTSSFTTLPPETIAGVFIHRGIDRTPLETRAVAGDIVTLAGVPEGMAVGDTITSSDSPVDKPIDTPPLAPPTLAMDFGANDGPLGGTEGTILTSSKVRERLMFETDNNVTLKVEPSVSSSERTTVYARGELQLGILIEQMRREGFEMTITPPRILTKTCPDTNKTLEPFEEVTVDVDSEYSGTVVNALTGDRKGVLLEMSENPADAKCKLVFEVPTRGLLGFSSEIATATKGSAVVNHLFLEDREYAGNLGSALEKGKLVSSDSGKATLYALSSISARGTLFIEPGEKVYEGMVIGENAKAGDLDVNPVRAKEKTNMRTVNKDEKGTVSPPRRITVEELIGYMSSDEVIEITPKSIRLRKVILDNAERLRAMRSKAKQLRTAKEKKG